MALQLDQIQFKTRMMKFMSAIDGMGVDCVVMVVGSSDGELSYMKSIALQVLFVH
jgi:nucleosome binding factor SPN SPT16 subunit